MLDDVENVNQANGSATIAGLLHDYMVQTGSTEAEVAELLGVDQTQVGRWRRGQTVPRPVNLEGLADLLNVGAAELAEVCAASERVRAEVKARKAVDPNVEVRRLREELRRAEGQIKRLERKLSEVAGLTAPSRERRR